MAIVVVTTAAQDQIEQLPLPIHMRVEQVIKRLSFWPNVSGAKPLRGDLAGQFRVRTGDYRVQFCVAGRGAAAVVTITKVGKRDRFYD